MKRKILFISIITLILLFSILFTLSIKRTNNKSCTAHIYSNFEYPNKKGVSYKLDLRIVNNDDGGHIKLVGTITTDKTYSINRVVHYAILETSEVDSIRTDITFVRKSKKDDVSDSIFNQYFKAFSLGVTSYSEVNKISSGRYLISSSFGPYFVCEMQANDELPTI